MKTIVYYVQILDSWGKQESSIKGDYIFNALMNTEEWDDNLVFRDSEGVSHTAFELQGQEVSVPDIGVVTVPKYVI